MDIVAFGKNTVMSIIKSDFLELKRVIICEEKKNDYNLFCQEAASKKIPCAILTRENFARHIPDKKHQGIIAFVKSYNYSSLSYLLRRKTTTHPPVLVMLDGIEDPHNFGAILRTCAAFDINGVIISSRNQVPVNSTVLKVSTGGLSYLPICMVSSLEETVNTLKNSNFKLVSTVCSAEREVVNYRDFSSPEALCIILGSEHSGVKKSILKKSDFLLTVPMKNAMNSLNVSVSCGVILSALLHPAREHTN